MYILSSTFKGEKLSILQGIIRERTSLAIFKNKQQKKNFHQHIVLKYIFFLLMGTLIYFITTVMFYNSQIALLL